MDAGGVVAGRYRLVEELGRGGMGTVWRAVDLELGREVALKQAVGGSAGQIRREAKVGAGLLHPHVVAVFDTVIDQDEQWLVTEYVAGASLDRIIEAEGPLSDSRALKIGGQLAAALVAIHERGIVHRDVKPANILVTDDDVAKLTDLGIARWTEVTQSGGSQLTGTLGYVAPEVANGAEATAASDVFSLGATLYAAVEGRSPWGDGADGPFAQIRRAGEGAPMPRLRAQQIAPLLEALMARDPANRPSAAEAAELIQRGDVTRSYGIRLRRRSVSRRQATQYSVGALLICIALLAWLLPHRPDPETTSQELVGLGPEPAAADPCAAIPDDALRSFGRPFVDHDLKGFSSCVVTTTLGDGSGQVQTVLDFTSQLAHPPRPVVAGQMGEIDRPEISRGSCERSISLPDTNRVVISSRPVARAKDAPICAISESMLSAVLATIGTGPLKRRLEPFAPESLANADACSMLDANQAAAALITAGPARQEFGGWGCTREGTFGEINVRFSRERPIESDADWGGKLIKVVDRQARLIPEPENASSCTVLVVHRRYTPPRPVMTGAEPDRQELVTVRLIDTITPDSATVCAKTRTLAESVVRLLPAAG